MTTRVTKDGITLQNVAGIILRRDPDHLGGCCTVSLWFADGREVEVISDAGELIDHCVHSLGIAQSLNGER